MKYIGITIGPIFKTIDEAISPAGLWFASTIFSGLSKELCFKIEEKFEKAEIFSPFFNESHKQNDGVGKFHDRIMFCLKSFDVKELDQIILEAKHNIIRLMTDSEEEFNKLKNKAKKYFQIEYVVLDEEKLKNQNIVYALNNALDSLELMMVNESQDVGNLFSPYFIGEKDNRNLYIKKSKLFETIEGENFLKSSDYKGLKSIESITDLKNNGYKYFAVINSDGDKVGNLLTKICTNNSKELPLVEQIEKVKSFSKSCMEYAENAAKIINKNSGMTIYAGGDDLLFIAPINNINRILIHLNKLFIKSFVNNKDLGFKCEELQSLGLSLSFGVSIQYQKFPLYEALKLSRQNLYEAKKSGGNQVSFFVQKHSGQSFNIRCLNNELGKMSKIAKEIHYYPDVLKSISFKLGEVKAVLQLLIEESIENKWDKNQFFARLKNHFDNDNQNQYEDYIKKISDFYFENYISKPTSTPVEDFQKMIRFITFSEEALFI